MTPRRRNQECVQEMKNWAPVPNADNGFGRMKGISDHRASTFGCHGDSPKRIGGQITLDWEVNLKQLKSTVCIYRLVISNDLGCMHNPVFTNPRKTQKN
jgi:hypothetical protein